MNQGFEILKKKKILQIACESSVVVVCWDLSSSEPVNFSGETELKNYLSDIDPSDIHPSPLASFKFSPFLAPSFISSLFFPSFSPAVNCSPLTFHCRTRKIEAFILFSPRKKPSTEINIIPAESSP